MDWGWGAFLLAVHLRSVSAGLLWEPLGHAIPLTFVSQRLDSEALEREEVARGVKLGTAKQLEDMTGRVKVRVPLPCYQDPVIYRSSAQG